MVECVCVCVCVQCIGVWERAALWSDVLTACVVLRHYGEVGSKASVCAVCVCVCVCVCWEGWMCCGM